MLKDTVFFFCGGRCREPSCQSGRRGQSCQGWGRQHVRHQLPAPSCSPYPSPDAQSSIPGCPRAIRSPVCPSPTLSLEAASQLQTWPPPPLAAWLILTLLSFLPSFLLPALSQILPHRLVSLGGTAMHSKPSTVPISPARGHQRKTGAWQDQPVPQQPHPHGHTPRPHPCTTGTDPEPHGSGMRGCLGHPKAMHRQSCSRGAPSRPPHCHVLGTSMAPGPVPQSPRPWLPARGHGLCAAGTPCPHSAHTPRTSPAPAATVLERAGHEGEQQGREHIMGWISLSSAAGGI